jgi:hypothetical protein
VNVRPEASQAMPSNRHSIHKNNLARAMVAQTEQAFLAIARGSAPKEPTVRILEYKGMALPHYPTKLHSLADLRVFLVPRVT